MTKTKMKNKSKKVLKIKRKKVKQQILKAQTKSESILQIIPSGVFTVDLDRKITSWNRMAEVISGVKAKDVIGRKCTEIWNCPMCLKKCRLYAKDIKKPFFDKECAITLPNRKQLLASKNVACILGEDGEIVGGIEAFIDIGERKKMEEERERLMRSFDERLKELQCLYHLSNIIERPGITLERIFHETVNILPRAWQYPGITCGRIIFEDKEFKTNNLKISKWRQAADIELYGKKVGVVEVYYLKEKDKIYEGPFTKEERDLINAVAERLGKVAERKKGIEDLKRAYQVTHDILEKSPFGVYLVNSKGAITYVNPRMIKIAGEDYNRFKRLNVFNLPSYKKIGLDNKIKSVLKGKSFFMGPVKYTSYYGRKTTIRNFIGIPFVGKETDKGAIIFVEDISRLKKAEEDFKETQKELLQSEKMATIGRLATGVAHEIKNPLATILQGIEYLEENASIDDRKNSLVLGYIKDAILRTDNIINELLDFSAAPKIQIKNEKLNSVLKKSLFLIKYQLEKNKIRLIKDFKTNIPSIKIDKNKIQQAFINIFMNAIQAMPRGGELKVTTYIEKLTKLGNNIGRRKDDKFRLGELAAIVEIEDTGPGIPEDVLGKIFDPFFTTKTIKGRIGVGLAITRGIINSHNGLIKIENKKDSRGAKVTIMFKI